MFNCEICCRVCESAQDYTYPTNSKTIRQDTRELSAAPSVGKGCKVSLIMYSIQYSTIFMIQKATFEERRLMIPEFSFPFSWPQGWIVLRYRIKSMVYWWFGSFDDEKLMINRLFHLFSPFSVASFRCQQLSSSCKGSSRSELWTSCSPTPASATGSGTGTRIHSTGITWWCKWPLLYQDNFKFGLWILILKTKPRGKIFAEFKFLFPLLFLSP